MHSCSRAHLVSPFPAADEFEGTKKSCRRKLKRHNERRRVEFVRGDRDSEAEEVSGAGRGRAL